MTLARLRHTGGGMGNGRRLEGTIATLPHGHSDHLAQACRIGAEPAERRLCRPVRPRRRLGLARTFDQNAGSGGVRRSDVRRVLFQVVAWRVDRHPGERCQMILLGRLFRWIRGVPE